MVKDKLPTRKKRIITAIILVFSVLAPLLILLIVKNIEKDQGWFNSSWLYRRSLHVSGSASSLLSEEILIEYDTESLILSNKLLPNCADLRFVDSDNHSLLQYWIEGGCNTTTTHIWVRIPTIPRGGKTIYMYYGNTEAVSAQEAWHGKFFLLNNQTCETNWEIESNPTNPFYQKFFMSLNEYGQSGGEAKHTHNESNVTKEMLEGTLAVKLGEDSTVAKEHKHKVSFETERSEILPPYYDLLVCSNSQLTLPTNSILLFDKESPKEFTRFKELDNKFPRGSDTPNTFSDEGEHTHHIENINIENLADTSKCALGNTEISSLKHIHTLESLSVSKEKIMPPYIEMVFAQNENSTMAPSGSITISSALPPLGWALFEPLENRFPLGQSEYGNTGGSETHAHSYNITLSKSKELEKCSLSTGKQNFAVGQHNHNLSGELQLGSSIPPYISVLYIKKKDSLRVTVNDDEALNLPPNPPTELLVNRRRSPLISIFNPSFSAVFSDPNKEDTGEYFQIEISTDSTFSSNILWDSKKQSMPSTKNGERSAELKYRGSKLNESLYYWRIKFWDNNGNEGAWSEVSTFRIVKKERVILNGLESQDVLGAKTENYYSEATTENATTSTVYQDKTTLTFTPEANSNYLLISSWLLQQSNTSYLTYSKLTRSSGAAKNFNELAYQPKNGTDYVSGGGIGIDSFGSSPTQQTYKIQYRTSNASGIARIKEASIFALKLEEEDKYAQVESRSTTTAVTYQDKTTLTFTPSTPGEYIILASATIDSIAPAGWGLAFPVKTALNIDGTPYSEISMLPTDEANRFPWFVVKRVNLNATSHTIKIQYSATQSGSFTSEIGIADARIVVIRADRFSNNYYAEEEARATTTSTAYQTRTTLTATPENEEHLILAVQDLDISSTSQSAYGRVAKGASSYGEMSVETFDANNRGYQYFTVKKETLSNTSTSWYSQYRSSNASATAGITGARISVIELSQSGSTPEPPPPPTTAENFYSESSTQSTTTSTAYQDKTTLTFTPEANSSYLLISSWLFQQSHTSYFTYSKLARSSGTSKDFNELIYKPKNATDYISGGAFGIDSFGASPTEQTYKIQYRTSNAAGTARIKEANIFALKLEEDDKYAEEEAYVTTTSQTYVDRTTLTFTPPTAGEYIILASATLSATDPYGWAGLYATKTVLNIDGTPYSETSILPIDTSNRFPWFVVKRVNFNSSSHTIKIQYSTTGSGYWGGAAGIADARIVAIRADRFLNNYYAENEARATTTSTTYQTRTTLTTTPRKGDHLVLAVQDLDISLTTQSVYGRLAKGASDYGEMSVEANNVANRGYQYFTVKKETLTNTSTSWNSQYRSSSTSATAGIASARISLLDLTEPITTVGTTGTQIEEVSPNSSAVYIGGAFTFKRDLQSTKVTSITINQTGTISNNNISGLTLYYKEQSTCSTSIPQDATKFNTTPGTFSSGKSTVTGNMNVGTSQVCVYVELDVGPATPDDTIDIEITSPTTDIIVEEGEIEPESAVKISGTTSIKDDSPESSSQSHYSESSTENTTTSTVYQDKTSLTFTPEANSSYLLISSWLSQQSNTSYFTYSKLTRSSGISKDFNELIYRPKNATDYISGGGIGIDSFGASPTQQTYKIQYRTSNAAGTARIKEANIFALKLEDEDKYAEVEARTTTTQTTYQDRAILTFTPSTAGEYIILASATLDSVDGGWAGIQATKAALNIDGTPYSEISILPIDASNRFPWFVVKRVNLSSAPHTIKIQYSSTSGGWWGGTAGIADARIVAIRADRFSNNYYAENDTRATTTSTSYQTRTTLTATPKKGDHLVLAVQDLDISSTSQSVYGNVLKGSTSYGEMSVEANDATNRGYQYFTVKKEALTDSPTSWYSQYRSSSSSATAGISNARISLIDLTEHEPAVNVGTTGSQIEEVFPNSPNTYIGGAFTFTRDSQSTQVTGITVNQTGTISNNNISGLTLYYKQQASCSSSIPGDATKFNTTPGTFSSGKSTVTGNMTVGTSQVCVYVEANIGGATPGDTIDVEITNPAKDINVQEGGVEPSTAVNINGITTVKSSNQNPNPPSNLYTQGSTNPKKVSTTTPYFSAIFTDPDASDMGMYYEIQVNTNSSFTGTTMWSSNKTSISPITNGSRSSNITYNGSTLQLSGTTYYWRIRFWDNNDTVSDWSSTAQFTMSGAPSAPSSLLTEGQTNPTGVTNLTPKFSAIHTDPNEDSATHYEIHVNTSSNFYGTVMWNSTKTSLSVTHNTRSADISYAGTSLARDGATYYWRIRFWDTDGNVSNWSSTAQFTMYNNIAPNAPSSLQTQGATNPKKVSTTTPYFSAVFSDPNTGDTGVYYELQVNTNNSFTGTVMWSSNKTSISPITNGSRSSNITYNGSTLQLNGTTYYWRIRFWDNYDTVSNWSSTAQFTMSGAPNTPSSLLTEGQTNPTGVTSLTPKFSAIHTDPNEDSATHYEIHVNTSSNFYGTVMWNSTKTSLSVAHNARSADISYAGTPLARDGATYYWRIRFWDTDGNISNWSSTAQFAMYNNIAPNAPSSLLTQGATNPKKVSTTTPYFSAVFSDPNTGDTGVYYELQVNTNNSFTGTVMWSSNKTSISPITNGSRSSNITYNGSTLQLNGTTYYWRIRFWDNNDTVSNWSSTAQFTMSGAPSAPSSLLTEGQTNPTGVTSLVPKFSAIHTDPNEDSATHYEIHVNTSSNFYGTVMWNSTKTSLSVTHNTRSADISYSGTPLARDGATYYWRIRFWDTDGNVSNWSTTAQFAMYNNIAPNAPSSLQTQGSTNPKKVSTTTPYFSAIFTDPDASDTGEYYEIQVNTNSSFTGTVMWSSNKTSISPITNGSRSSNITYNGSTLQLDGTTYYWRIRFWDDSDAVSSWSSTAQFTMSGPPNAPSDLLTEGQTNPTTVTNLAPKFSAIHTDPNEDSAIYYEIHVNTNDSFTGTEMWNSSKTSISSITNGSRSSNITYNGSALSPSYTTYYWRIRFWDTDDNMSDWSSTAQFTTYSNATPYAPSSLQTQGSTDPKKVSTTTPYFSAIFTDPNASDTGEYYEIEVNTEDSFTGTVMWSSGKSSISSITNGSRSSNITYNGSTLQLDGTTYYWRIRFWDNADAVSSWSPTAQFTMLGPPNSPLNLTVDEMKNPMRITSLTPNFSAMHTDPNEDSATHYEIHVNTNQNFNGTVMWNSGKKSMTSTPSGTKSPDIPYNGTPLTGTSDTTYYWRIRFWVSDNEVSEWSPVATFTDYIDDKQYIQMEGVLLKGVKINPPANLPPSAPTNLNPHSVSAFWITFSAQFNDPDIDDTGVYYQIEVNTNETFTGTVMWDSGKTSIAPIANGTQSSNIEYDGSSLSKNVTYYWRIKFWDNKGLYSPWSVSTCVVPSGQGQ